jgi:predicted permease
MLNDVRYAIRMLAKHPGFAVVAVLTLALGIGVNAAVFSLVSDYFLRPLPATDPKGLVVIVQRAALSDMAFPFSYPDFLDFRRAVEGGEGGSRDMATAFSGLMAYKDEVVHLSRAGAGTERAWVHAASGNYFSVLGVQPLLGRLFLPHEGRQPGADPILVLTHDAWRSRFASDPRIVGQQVKVNGVSLTVVGVTPPGFVGGAWGTALSGFVPATMLPQLSTAHGGMIDRRGDTGFFMMGRLQPGASVHQAQSAVDVLMARLVTNDPAHYAPKARASVLSESRSRPSPFIATFVPLVVSALMAMALLVLAVAAANVSNLLFARLSSRQRELAVRGALGASRFRLLRQLLMESVCLALAAATVGTVAALAVIPSLSAIGPGGDLAPGQYAGTDWRLFAFVFGMALLTGVVVALVPALKATRADVFARLKEGAGTMMRGRRAFTSTLVVAQVAVSCVVLTVAGLALRSLQTLSNVHLGFQPQNLLLASFDLGLQRYSTDQGRQFHARLLEQVRALPGVRDASLAENVPFEVGGSLSAGVTAEGRPPDADADLIVGRVVADHAFLKTTGLPVIEGRDFTSRDDAAAPRVAIVNQVLALRLWPNGSALGGRLVFQGDHLEVVGVVGEARYYSLTDASRPLVFRPLAQNYRGKVTLTVRTMADPIHMVSSVQHIVRGLDPDLPLHDVRTMKQQLARSPLALQAPRIGVLVAGTQGTIALFLATLGIFGLVSFDVTRRTHEIGVRVALGARAADVVRLISTQSVRLTLVGLAFGLLLTVGLTRPLAPLLYGVKPTDAVVLGSTVVVILAASLLACYLPARRAARADPMTALRCE